MVRKQQFYRKQLGTSMVEVLVAVLVLSFGLVGISALQARAIKNSGSAVVRGDLSQLSVALGESLRANPFGARDSMNAGCTATQVEKTLRDNDYFTYFKTFYAADNSSPNNRLFNLLSADCTNTVDWNFWQRWDDSRGVGGSANAAIGLYYRF